MTDLVPERQTTVVPIENHGHGEDHARIIIKAGELSLEAVGTLFGVFKESRVPITIQLAGPEPPPQFVSLAEAAKVTGTHPDHVRAMVAAGHLQPIYWRPERDGTLTTTVEVADLRGDFSGWKTVVDYPALVELCNKAREVGRFPVPENRRLRSIRYRKNTNRTSVGGASVAALVRKAVETACVDGEPVWIATRDVVARATDLMQAEPVDDRREVTSSGVTKALQHAKRGGLVESRKEGYNPRYATAHGYQWRWKGEPVVVRMPYDYEEAKQRAGWVAVDHEPSPEDQWIRGKIAEGDTAYLAELERLIAEVKAQAEKRRPELIAPANARQTLGPKDRAEKRRSNLGAASVPKGQKKTVVPEEG